MAQYIKIPLIAGQADQRLDVTLGSSIQWVDIVSNVILTLNKRTDDLVVHFGRFRIPQRLTIEAFQSVP